MISSRFVANLIRVTVGFTLGFALVAPSIAGLTTTPPSTSIDPEPADFEGANPGHQVEFRKVNGDIENLAGAIALLNLPPGHPNFSWEAHDDGVAVINYSDWGTSAPTQGSFGNDRDVRVIPGSYFSGEDTDGYVMRASGFIYIPTPGDWTFTVNSDDGCQLSMGNPLINIISAPDPQGPTDRIGVVQVAGTGYYGYELIYFERDGGSEVEFFAIGPGQTNSVLVGATNGLLRVFQQHAAVLDFEAASYSASESNQTATVTIIRTGNLTNLVMVNYAVTSDTATASDDFAATAGTLTFAAGETNKTFAITLIDDLLPEADESMNVILNNPSVGAKLGNTNSAVLTILDNDPIGSLQFSAGAYQFAEGNHAIITILRTDGSAGEVTVEFAATNATAIAGVDFTATNGVLIFAAGVTSNAFVVPLADNSSFNANKTVNLTLSTPTGGATLGSLTNALLTIVDNDPPGALQFSASAYRGAEGRDAIISVVRTGGSAGTVSVQLATRNGTAMAEVDYLALNGNITFEAGVIATNVILTLLDNSLIESNKTLSLVLSNPTGSATLGMPSTMEVTIEDNEPLPALFITDATLPEGNHGKGAAMFTIILSPLTAKLVTVDFVTANGTAQAGGDYEESRGRLVFNPGESFKTVAVVVNRDTEPEADEMFFVKLSNATNASIAVDEGGGTLLNDDGEPPPALAIQRQTNNVTVSWPTNAVGFQLEFTLALPPPVWNAVSNVISVVGAQNTVSLEAGSGSKFFRLQKP